HARQGKIGRWTARSRPCARRGRSRCARDGGIRNSSYRKRTLSHARRDATKLCLRQFYPLRFCEMTRTLPFRCRCLVDCIFNCISRAARVIGSDMRLLIVEDETRIAELVKAGLVREGFAVDVVGQCSDARAALAVTSYDAAVVDLGLPDGDGLDLLRELRT